MAKKNDLTIQDRINAEVERLTNLYSVLDEDSMSCMDGLIKRSAFMRITLEDYEKDIIQGGSVEMFTQSERTEPYERERPVVKMYNTMNKNYQSIMKQLNDSLPESVGGNEGEELLNFAFKKTK